MAIATMAFTYSIANGICTSFIFYRHGGRVSAWT